MKNLFSKTLLCGVLATSFLLINCQKAPNRGVKAQINPTAKPQAAKIGDCTADVASDYSNLKALDKQIQEKLKSLKGTVSDADKDALDTLATQMNDLSKKVVGGISTLKFDECKIYEGNDPKKKQIDSAKVMTIKQVRSGAGAAIKAKTGRDNDITKDDASDAAATLSAGQEFKIINADLASALSKSESSRGNVVIVAGKVLSGAEADAALNDKTKTVCKINVAKDEDIKPDQTILKVISVGGVKDEAQRKMAEVQLEAKVGDNGSAVIGLKCNIADEKVSEAAKEIRSALGDLVSAVVKAAPVVVTPAPTKADLEKAVVDASEELGMAEMALNNADESLKAAQAAYDADKENAEKKKALDLAVEAKKSAQAMYDAAKAKANTAMAALKNANAGAAAPTSSAADKTAKANEGTAILNAAAARK